MEHRSEPIDPLWLTARLDVATWMANPPKVQPAPTAMQLRNTYRSRHEGRPATLMNPEAERSAVREVIQPGDELWAWCEMIGKGSCGASGYAILRGGQMAHCWTTIQAMEQAY